VKFVNSNLEQTLIQKIHVLPPEKQAKVLEYVEEIEVEHSTNGFEESEEAKQKARLERVMKLCGIGRSKTGDVSQRVDEILAEGINKREGWSLP
jgi:hypothetical protein